MEKFNYLRKRQSFFSGAKSSDTNELKRELISNQINAYLNNEGINGGEIIYYNETLIDEGTAHISVVFKYLMF
jgi:hypothetical protein